MRRLRWLDGIADHGHESGRSPGDAEGPGSLACVESPGAGHDLVTEQRQRQGGFRGSGSRNVKRPGHLRTSLPRPPPGQHLL